MTRNFPSRLGPEPSSPQANAAGSEPLASARARLLVVDDIFENRNILARRFQRHGFDISGAAGGHQALEMIRERTFDLVLLDVMMPDLSGVEVLKKIRETYPPDLLPVIMVTAKSLSENVAEALDLGANDYVTKPVDFTVALARVNAQLARKRTGVAAHEANTALTLANGELERRVAERTAKLREANERLQAEIAQREQWQAQIEHLAHHDPLTGLANRTLFCSQLDQAFAWARQHDEPLAILFVDLDEFKTVNDSLGHSIGDALLKCVATRLADSIKDADRAARLGGDEFAIIQVGEKQPGGAASLASRLLELIARPCPIDGHQIFVGASIGIAISDSKDGDSQQLLKNADIAMYNAKSEGRGTFCFFEPGMDKAVRARRALEIDLRAALSSHQFDVYYQPLLNLKTDQLTGFEALLRWKHPEHGFVPPTEFIPVAEEMGLIIPIGEWVLNRACAEAVAWPGDPKVAVNLSPIQFRSGKLVETVGRALSASGLPPRRLELEITEAVLLEKAEANLEILDQLRKIGVRICMDDFGTGYSNLSYLRNFQFDKIKIDQSFIRDLNTREQNRAIIRVVAALGVSFGLTTTAEGVETEEQLNWLREVGCSEVQGYIYSQALPVGEIPDLIRRFNQLQRDKRRP